MVHCNLHSQYDHLWATFTLIKYVELIDMDFETKSSSLKHDLAIVCRFWQEMTWRRSWILPCRMTWRLVSGSMSNRIRWEESQSSVHTMIARTWPKYISSIQSYDIPERDHILMYALLKIIMTQCEKAKTSSYIYLELVRIFLMWNRIKWEESESSVHKMITRTWPNYTPKYNLNYISEFNHVVTYTTLKIIMIWCGKAKTSSYHVF